MNKDTMIEYKKYLWKRWLLDVTVRTVKTGAETAAGMITVGALLSDMDWLRILSVTAVAMIYTVLINIYRIAKDLEEAGNVEKSGESGEKSE